MKLVRYEDFPGIFDQVMDEVGAGVTFLVQKDGRPILRIEPVVRRSGRKSPGSHAASLKVESIAGNELG
jgi:antitoxin (DNA-binding transcriptional repressor) of toxin-antitoxin stability system